MQQPSPLSIHNCKTLLRPSTRPPSAPRLPLPPQKKKTEKKHILFGNADCINTLHYVDGFYDGSRSKQPHHIVTYKKKSGFGFFIKIKLLENSKLEL